MSDENLQILTDVNVHLGRAQWYKQIYEAYTWHFKIKDRPATFDEMIKFANWQGLKIKDPTKNQLVDFFLDKKIAF